MNDKEKQIKEMYQAFLDYKEATLCKIFTYKGMCENFINLGYTRISEDSVVLTQEEYTTLKLIENYHIRSCGKNSVVLSKEEYEDLQVGKDFNYGYHEGYKNMEAYYEKFELPEARKETAEKFAKEMLSWLEKDDIDGRNCVIEVAKQFGVEVDK